MFEESSKNSRWTIRLLIFSISVVYFLFIASVAFLIGQTVAITDMDIYASTILLGVIAFSFCKGAILFTETAKRFIKNHQKK